MLIRRLARICLIAFLAVFVPILILIARAQTLDCSDVVKTALATTGEKCAGITRNKACYGNSLTAATPVKGVQPANFVFQNPADQVAVADVGSLRLAALDAVAKQWGVAYMRIQANLPDTAVGQYVTMLLFGDSQVQNAAKTASTADTSYQPMQAVYLKTGVGSPVCHNAPTSGMIIQSPGGKQKVNLLVDGVQLSIGSTVLLQMDSDDLPPLPNAGTSDATSTPPPTNTPRSPTKVTPAASIPMKLVITTIEGEVRVTTGGLTRLARTGQQITVNMNDSVNDSASDTPNDVLAPVGLPSSPVFVNIKPILSLYIGTLIGRNLLNPTDAPVYVPPLILPATRTPTNSPTKAPPAAPSLTPIPPVTLTFTPTPAPVVVTNLNDGGPGSLRAALTAVAPNGNITFQSGLTGTLTLTSGELSIPRNLTINGPGASVITVINQNGRDFNVGANITASIAGLTLTASNLSGNGGAILNAGNLNVTACVFAGDFTTGQGGALYNSGTLGLNSVQITNPGSEIGIDGIFNTGTLFMNSSTVNGTQIGDGVNTSGSATIVNSTIFGVKGAAIKVTGGTLTLLADTLAGSVGQGLNASGGGVSIQNTILAQNAGGDIGGAVTSLGYNLIDDTTGGTLSGTDRRNMPAGLTTPPSANGGFAQTIALSVNSPAIDAIPIAKCAVTSDERGTARPQGAACDIGAFE